MIYQVPHHHHPATGPSSTDNNNLILEDMLGTGEEDPLRYAKRFNTFGKVVYIVTVVVFNIVFWIVAINEFVIPPEEYL